MRNGGLLERCMRRMQRRRHMSIGGADGVDKTHAGFRFLLIGKA